MAPTEVIFCAAPEQWMFWCPGCECGHGFNARWTFNGDLTKPTIKPSLLSTFGKSSSARCHLFMEDGKLRFLKDCTHDLAGKTISMEPHPWGKP